MKKLLMSQEALGSMLEMPLLSYTSDMTKNDNAPDTLSRALALFSLLLHERETGDGCAVDRICEHLCAVSAEGNAPAFDAICLWSYCPFSASIALAKSMPSVWGRLTDEVKERLAFAMEMYAYLESFATSDFNAYRTGPGLTGNYGKTWNPNYRLANVPVMVFVTHFFGNGDMKQGAENVNNMLHSFDEKTYERVVDTIDKYGWHRAKAVWTTPARMHEDGTYGTDARHVLLYGGTTYTSQYAHTPVIKESGDGAGVTNGGKDYLYNGFALSEPEGIIEHLLRFNYSGGEVKSNHHYDVDKDGVAELVAWISDESQSPYQGRPGMMKEFASGNRSSTGYCSHDFVLCTCLIAAAKALSVCDISENKSLWELIEVGNGDFLYKNEIGYKGFATGSYGTSSKEHSERNEGAAYFAMKSLWLNSMKSESQG